METQMTLTTTTRFFNLAAAYAAAGFLAVLPAHAQSVRLKSELSCKSHGIGPTLVCQVDLRDPAGQPVTGAKVSFGAMMPSMPMAHSVKPVAARDEGRPGRYTATLELEMMGGWAVEIDVAAPTRDRLVHTLLIQPCNAEPCVAKPISAAAAREHHKEDRHRHRH
jgi:hypothetical protein